MNYIFRNIQKDEAPQAAAIETACFPPNEACAPDRMVARVNHAPEMFLVVEDTTTGKLAGFINGLATNEEKFSDDFFRDETLYDPSGANVMILGLDVLEEHRGQGLARELMKRYAKQERGKGRKSLVLTCLPNLVKMYEKMGFVDLGISGSTWGGEEWHEMVMRL